MDKTSEKERMDEMIEATMKVARGDYSVQVELSGKNDEVDSLAMGLNMMIDDIRTSEEALRESEGKYKALFENLNDAAFLADVETGRILDTNKQGELLLGRTREEIIGIHQSKLHPAGMANEYYQRFLTHAQKGRVADYDGEVVRKDGQHCLSKHQCITG